MKNLWIRIRCWISLHALPKEVRPIFVNAVSEFADKLRKELGELEKERRGEQ